MQQIRKYIGSSCLQIAACRDRKRNQRRINARLVTRHAKCGSGSGGADALLRVPSQRGIHVGCVAADTSKLREGRLVGNSTQPGERSPASHGRPLRSAQAQTSCIPARATETEQDDVNFKQIRSGIANWLCTIEPKQRKSAVVRSASLKRTTS